MTTPEPPDRFPHGAPDAGSAPIPVKLDPYRTLNEES